MLQGRIVSCSVAHEGKGLLPVPVLRAEIKRM